MTPEPITAIGLLLFTAIVSASVCSFLIVLHVKWDHKE